MSSRADFRPTRWSIVAAATSADASTARRALQDLCTDYWQPLYAFVRHRGFCAPDAEDIVQSFLLHLLERDYFASASQEKGRFRSYLIGSLNRFLATHLRKERAEKRGGKAILVSMDDAAAHYVPDDAATPENLYDQKWALAVLEKAIATLEAQWHAKGNADAFQLLKPALTAPTAEALDTAAAAATLGIPRDQVKVRVHRLRTKFRELLLSQVAETLQSHRRSDAENELRLLLAAIS